jgi:NADH:ubiquinone oxidoreductase subunit E
LGGAYQTCRRLEEALDVKVGHTSENGKVTLEFVECHADCGKAPVVMVGEKEFTDVGLDAADALAEKIKNGTL